MKRITLLILILISTFHFSAYAQEMSLSKDSFEGDFVIDSTFTSCLLYTSDAADE